MTNNVSLDLDFGPLEGLIGVWQGDKGQDIAPEPDGSEESPFYETIRFEPLTTVTNAESQNLAAVRYHQSVSRKSNNEVFHDEAGFWMWDAERSLLMHSLAIPRGVCVLAGGSFDGPKGDGIVLEVKAAFNDPDWGIIQSPFMRDNARTTEFEHKITLRNGTLHYFEKTIVEIYGRVFEHTDQNELARES